MMANPAMMPNGYPNGYPGGGGVHSAYIPPDFNAGRPYNAGPTDPLLYNTLHGIQRLLEQQQANQGVQNHSMAFIQDQSNARDGFKLFPAALSKDIKKGVPLHQRPLP